MKRQHRSIAGALSLMILLLDPVGVAAQRAPIVEPGVQVRIYSPDYSGVATVEHIASDTLWVAATGFGNPVAVPLQSLNRLERWHRPGLGMRALHGAKWGALVGAGIGAMGIVMSERGPGDPPQATWPVVGAAIFAVPGALIGSVRLQGRWERVPLPGRVNLSWGGGGIQISAGLTL